MNDKIEGTEYKAAAANIKILSYQMQWNAEEPQNKSLKIASLSHASSETTKHDPSKPIQYCNNM
jgi:hypothetical protein